MNSFNGLLKKDLKLGLPFLYTSIIIVSLGLITSIVLSSYYKTIMLVAIFAITFCFAHVFYLPSFLLTSLNIEGKTQLWLHNPNSSIKLLLSKWITGILYSIISLFLMYSVAVISMYVGELKLAFNQTNLFFMCLILLGISIYLSSWVFFSWTLYHSMKKIVWLNKIRWVVLILLWNIWNIAVYWFNRIPVIDALKRKSVISVDNTLAFEARRDFFKASIETTEISIFSLCGYILTLFFLFLIASWLLEKKVEV